VVDDGRGLPKQIRQRCTGLGLRGMRERVIMVGGTFEVKSRSPHGAVVQATLPVEDKWTAEFPDHVESDLEGDHAPLTH
jgi:signal transduction histidine kinase